MKMFVLIAGVCGAAAIVAVAAQQERGFGGRGGQASRLSAAIDADHDGVVSATEIRGAAAGLGALDVNRDGLVSGDEIRPAGGRDGGPGRRGRGGEEGRGGASAATADELTDTLMAFDRNADGRLERAEVPERFQGLFDRADGNKDGALTRDELKQSATASAQAGEGRGPRGGGREGGGFGRGRGGPVDPLMRALDADRDGALSQSEIAGAAAALTTLDVNHDGQLSGEELRPAAPGGPGGRGERRR